MLVLNKCGKTKWLSGTIVQQKSPVTYLVKVGSRIRFCHADHLLHSAVINIDSEQDIEDLSELTCAPVMTEPEITDSTTGAELEGISVPVPVQHSNWEIRAPCRLIEEL